MKNIYIQIPDLLYPDSSLVLATVTRSYGSTPQKPGSSALFNKNGIIETTKIKFDAYYGYELTQEESYEFCFSNY